MTSPNTCRCGHDVFDHEYLPGHPDNASECDGSDECECGKFEPKP